MSRRIALLLEYDGAPFGGSQRQENAPTVQAALEEAIQRLSGERVRSAFAGRTDAGVHALGQVATFDTAAAHPPEVWQRALNALLPEQIGVRAAVEAPPGFDPRRHARRRHYRYQVWNAPARSPLRRHHTWHVRDRLDLAAMRAALAALPGEHDFAAFGGPPGEGRSTWRRMDAATLQQRGPLLHIELTGNAFLPHQVRRTVGALVEIGRARRPASIFAGWLAEPVPGIAGPAAPPQGLYLVAVEYDGVRFEDGKQHQSTPPDGIAGSGDEAGASE